MLPRTHFIQKKTRAEGLENGEDKTNELKEGKTRPKASANGPKNPRRIRQNRTIGAPQTTEDDSKKGGGN